MRLGPISLASHLSFSSISVTGLSDGLAGGTTIHAFTAAYYHQRHLTPEHTCKKEKGKRKKPTVFLSVPTYASVLECSEAYLIKQKCIPFFFFFMNNLF